MTVYAFSTENWKRAEEEVGAIMKLLKFYILDFFKSDDNNIKVKVIGKIEELPKDIYKEIKSVEEKTKNNTGMILNIAFNYGGRDELVTATKRISELVSSGNLKLEDITEETISKHLYTKNIPDPDLLIRTGGEMRVSNYLLWQIAYAEFIVIDKFWPEFNKETLASCVKEYKRRNRRFGK